MNACKQIRILFFGVVFSLLVTACQFRAEQLAQTIAAETMTARTIDHQEMASSIPTNTKTLSSTMMPSATMTPVPTLTHSPTITQTPTLAPGAEMIRESDGAVMVYVPEGEFIMGWDRDDISPEFMENCYNAQGWGEEKCEGIWWEENSPGHPVLIDYGFYIDKNEITNEMFVKHLNTLHPEVGKNYFPWLDNNIPEFNLILTNEGWTVNPGYENHPITSLTWFGAKDYCEAQGARLPTEAEWEKAARGTDGRMYPWGNEFNCSFANLREEFPQASHSMPGAPNCGEPNQLHSYSTPIGSFPQGVSPYGALDMLGNACEWVSDFFDPNYYEDTLMVNPTGPLSGLVHICKGEHFNEWEEWAISLASRVHYGTNENVTQAYYGFRCAYSETDITTQSSTGQPSNQYTPTPNPYQFNGYWLSPIEEGTGAYVQTYGNVCPEFFDGTDLSCIENFMGEKGTWPDDYFDILVCPAHVVEWDIAWDHWGEKVFAMQGGQVQSVELESNSTYGVHFFIVDQQSYGANYGHVDGRSLVESGIITQEQFEQVKTGESVDGIMVYEGQQLGVTGDDCCPNGVLHIGPVYRFWGTDANGEFFYTEPSELWQLGEWPDVADSRPAEAGDPCRNPYNIEIDDFWNK